MTGMEINHPDLSDLVQLAAGAGAILREGCGNDHQITYKGPVDLVTEMDHRSEEYILGEIRRRFPEHSILSEESGDFNGSAEHCWYVDPLDGTTNYAHGLPIFAVSIGYQVHGRMEMAVVYDPMRDECFSAQRGVGAWLNGKPIRVSPCPDLNLALLVTGFPYSIRSSKNNNLHYFSAFATRSQAVRRLGSAALDLCYVACGRLDGYWEIKLSAWDLAAGVLIVSEAGGMITDLDGQPDVLKPPYALVTANPRLHAQMLDVIREVNITLA